MCTLFPRLLVAGFGAVLLSGCGGVSVPIRGSGSDGTSSNGNTTVTVSFTGVLPSTVATRIGSGPFTPATLSSNSVSLQIPGGTSIFEVAYFCSIDTGDGVITFGNDFNSSKSLRRKFAAGLNRANAEDLVASSSGAINIFAASLLDGIAFTLEGCSDPASGANPSGNSGLFSGTVDASAISGVQSMFLTADDRNGDSGSSAAGFTSPLGFSFDAPAGKDRVEFWAYGVTPSGVPGDPSNSFLVAAKNWSNQAVPGTLNGGNTVLLGTADQTVEQPITYNHLPAGFQTPSTYVVYVPSGMQTGEMIADMAGAQYPMLPSGATQPGDYYYFQTSTANAGSSIFVTRTTDSGGPISVDLPAPWTYAGPTPAALPAFNFEYSGFSGTSARSVELSANWRPNASTYSAVEFLASENYMNGSTSLTLPDLSSLSGFPPPPASGNVVNWSAAVNQSSYGLLGMFGILQPVAANGTATSVVSSGTYSVP